MVIFIFKMKFTIFTSFYNYVDTFDLLVESIFNQTYQNWEWIISDDFSENPDVMVKLESLALRSNKIKLIQPKLKKEFYWNPPTNHSTGDIFLVQDSDDIMHPKLLEVYKHNFDKFPEVQMISTNSILRWNYVTGPIHSVRLINYNENCNFSDKIKNSVPGEYNIGDCRAWRNNIKLFDTERKWKFCAEDISKTLINEEIGKLLYLPRTLHTYTHRENSISKIETEDQDLLREYLVMIEEAEKRKSRKYLNSIEDYYDRIYSHTTPFYFSSFNTEKDSSVIEYMCGGINNRQIETLKSLYFDHDLVFEPTENVDYLICKIEKIEHLDSLFLRLKSLPKKEIIIETEHDLLDLISNHLNSVGLPFQWFLFGKMTIFINL